MNKTNESKTIIEQSHEGVCGGYFQAKIIYQNFLRIGWGYYWPTKQDYHAPVKKV